MDSLREINENLLAVAWWVILNSPDLSIPFFVGPVNKQYQNLITSAISYSDQGHKLIESLFFAKK